MRSRLIALALIAAPFAAHAQAETPCPTDMEQRLYTMGQKIDARQQTEIPPVLDLAKQTIETCPDRTHAQALAALLMSSVLDTAQSAEIYSEYLTLTNKAVLQNDLAWEGSPPKAVVTKLDGTAEDFFGYNFATRVYEQNVLPGYLRLWQSGTTHPLVTGSPDMPCPFAREDSKRFDDELLFWGKVAGAKEVRDRYTLIRTRLKALHTACPQEKLELSWALAESYGRELIRLTDWSSESAGSDMFGNPRRTYTIPIDPFATFSESEMRAKRTELDAQARPLVPFIKQYVDDYETAYKAVDRSKMSFRNRNAFDQNLSARGDRIDRWKEAIEQLEMPQ